MMPIESTRYNTNPQLINVLRTARRSRETCRALLQAADVYERIERAQRNSKTFNLMSIGLNLTLLPSALISGAEAYWPSDCLKPPCARDATRVVQTISTGVIFTCATLGMCFVSSLHRMMQRAYRERTEELTRILQDKTGLGVFVGLYAAADARQRVEIAQVLADYATFG